MNTQAHLEMLRSNLGLDTIEQAQEYHDDNFMGKYESGAKFAEWFAYESGDMENVPSYLAYHIDWADVWESTLRHDFFEVDGYFYQHV